MLRWYKFIVGLIILLAMISILSGCNNEPCTDPIILKDPDVSEVGPGQQVAMAVQATGKDLQFEWVVERGSLSKYDVSSVIYTAPTEPGSDIIIVVITCNGTSITKSITFTVIGATTEATTETETPREPTVIGTPTPTVTPVAFNAVSPKTTTPTRIPSGVMMTPKNAKQVTELGRWGKGAIEEIAYASDGKLAVASSGGVYLYHPETLEQIDFIKTDSTVVSLAFTMNGESVALGASDGTIQIRQVSDGTLMYELKEHTRHVSSLAFSEDGQRLISGSRDGTVQLWNVSEGTSLCVLNHTDPVESVAISPDGKKLASGTRDKIVKLWHMRDDNCSVKEADELGQEQGHHTERVDSVAFSPDGELLTSGDADGTLLVWRVSDGTLFYEEPRLPETHGAGIRSIAFSPNGTTLASGSYDQTVLLRFLTTSGDYAVREPKLWHTDSVERIAFSPDGRTLASRTRDNRVWLWRVDDGTLLRTLEDHTNWVRSVAFSADGKTIVTGSWDNTVRLWTTFDGSPRSTLKGNTLSVNSVAQSADGQTVASGGADLGENGKIKCLDGTVWRWQQGYEWTAVPSLKEHTECIENRGIVTDTVSSIAFSPDSETLATGALDNNVRLWQLSDRTLKETLKGHINSVLSVAFNHNGQLLASGAWDKTVRLWQVSDGTLLKTLEGHTGPVRTVAFSPDGQMLASGSSDNMVQLWQINKTQLPRTLAGHRGSVFSVAFSPDGQLLASGSLDGTVRLWQVETGALLHTLYGHTNTVYGVTFSPDGKMLVSGSRDGTVRQWGVSAEGTPSPQQPVTLTKEGVIKIGAAVSETGRFAREGKDVRQGYDSWADWVNNERGGILVGDKRYNVEMIYYDDEGHPDITAKLVQTLIAEDEVDFLLGPYSSGLTGLASAISEKYDVIMIGTATSDLLFERGLKNLFGVSTPASQYMNVPLEELAKRGAKTVVIAYKEEPFSKSIAEGAQQLWGDEYGLEVLEVQSFPESEDEAENVVGDIISTFREQEPDVFVGIGHYKEALLFVKKAKALGFNPKAIVIPVAPSNPQFVEDIGADANYIIGPTQWEEEMWWQGNHNSPIGTAAKYAEDYKQMWKESPTYQAAESTAAALALMVAIENAGSLETADVRAALNALNIKTFYGPINFDQTGKNTSKPMGVIQIQEGEIQVIGASEETDIIYPAPPWSER